MGAKGVDIWGEEAHLDDKQGFTVTPRMGRIAYIKKSEPSQGRIALFLGAHFPGSDVMTESK
jgi:hypothetical protein